MLELRHFIRHNAVRWAALGLWLTSIVFGMKLLMEHSFEPAATGGVARHWPGKRVTRGPAATLVMAVHPQCPCTRAGIEELSRILARTGNRLSVRLLFYMPSNQLASWRGGDLWNRAKSLPNVEEFEDRDGVAAKQFGLTTSGQTALYDQSGELTFTGGITGSRGHSGDNPGADAVLSFVTTGAGRIRKAPVFGCSILSRAGLSANGRSAGSEPPDGIELTEQNRVTE